MLLLEGLEKAHAIKQLLSTQREKKEGNRTFDRQLLKLENDFEGLCSSMVKVYNHSFGASVTEEQVQNWSVYRFYTLKNNLVQSKSVANG